MSNRTIGQAVRVDTLFSLLLAVPSFADSQARIVRLSQVDGDVQIDRNTGKGYEKAFINLADHSRREIRSENGRAC